MELTELINYVKVIQVTGNVQRKDVSSVEYDSRKVKKNSVFVAIAGFKVDGHRFVQDAINNGAIAVVIENDALIPDELFNHFDCAKILVKNTRIALAELSKGFFGEPGKKIEIIGITGTNGKTTTAFILKNIFDKAGYKSGLIGTIKNMIGQEVIESKLTTPESSDLNRLFYNMIQQNCKYAVMEVSSHSLYLNRVYGLDFSCGVFTNITSDHLDFHNTFENYFNAKKILFDSLPQNSLAVINTDDPNAKNIVKNSKANIKSYALSNEADFKISNISYDLSGTKFQIIDKHNTYSISAPLVGLFNAYNAAAAFTAASGLGLDSESIIAGIETMPQVPGRFEVISGGQKKVIVDYSHTADSLKKTLEAIREIVNNKREVVTVFGCGGDRDKTKRPEMGKIATELSDRVILTSDNPRTEDPFEIIDDIKSGISKNNYSVFENREEAISKAIINSNNDAVILVAGKGHESYQEINGVRNHFSDQEVVKKYLGE